MDGRLENADLPTDTKSYLSPNTPIRGFHDKEDIRKDFLYNATLGHRFWLNWMKPYIPTLQGRNKWRTVRLNLVPEQLHGACG